MDKEPITYALPDDLRRPVLAFVLGSCGSLILMWLVALVLVAYTIVHFVHKVW